MILPSYPKTGDYKNPLRNQTLTNPALKNLAARQQSGLKACNIDDSQIKIANNFFLLDLTSLKTYTGIVVFCFDQCVQGKKVCVA